MKLMDRIEYVNARGVKSLTAGTIRDDALRMPIGAYMSMVCPEYVGRAILVDSNVYALIEPGDVLVLIGSTPLVGQLTSEQEGKLAVLTILPKRQILAGFGAHIHNGVYLIAGK
jgi:hypothetical protein